MEKAIIFIKENIRLLLGAAVVIFFIVLFVTLLLSRKSPSATVNNHRFKVLVAKTDKEKQIGLSGREHLAENQGMFFPFDKPDYYSFWMKEMKFPIDIIYINGDNVTTVIENAAPPTSKTIALPIYKPLEPSNKVLEINAGQSKKYNIKKGTRIKIENL